MIQETPMIVCMIWMEENFWERGKKIFHHAQVLVIDWQLTSVV